jgi:XRE family transcriptional regulator, regulator of sulfur utilization
MLLYQKIIDKRKSKGLTQEELAEIINVNVRTIQRIESGKGIPSNYTLKSLATVLDITLEKSDSQDTYLKNEEAKHFLKILVLSCFSYLLIPYVHFLIPSYILKKRKEQNYQIISLARKIILTQIYWIIVTILVFLLTLAYNFVISQYFNKNYIINYIWIFLIMYFFNAFLILIDFKQIKTKKFY